MSSEAKRNEAWSETVGRGQEASKRRGTVPLGEGAKTSTDRNTNEIQAQITSK